MNINNLYNIGDILFLKTDPEQLERICHKITITKGDILYSLACGSASSDHYDFEISSKKDLMKELNISSDIQRL